MKFSPSQVARAEKSCGMNSDQLKQVLELSVKGDELELIRSSKDKTFSFFDWERDRFNAVVMGPYLDDQRVLQAL